VQKGIAALWPKAVVLVGIAFGVDEQKQAIGDILVSRQLWLYDLQRVGADKIIPRGDKPHASSWLIDYLRSAKLYWKEPDIVVRFDLVLSGEKLVDNIDYREQLKQFEPEAIGGEMEGAGLYVACQDAKVDWILVKAICDWADGHKAQDKDARQQQAARNAATFVAHALQHVPLVPPKQPDLMHSVQNVAMEKSKHSIGLNLGQVKINLCQRLVSDWPSLADYFEIPPADRARFDRGWEPQRVWEWLESCGKLAKLAEGLRYIGRDDLANLLPKELPNRPR
jgi:nucleoside phosphorylase